MIHDFISVFDNSFTSDECEEYINLVEHYISNGVITKEDRAYHNTDHFSINFNNDVSYNILSGDNLSMEFLPKIKDFVGEYLKKFSVLGQEKLLIYDTKAKKIPIGAAQDIMSMNCKKFKFFLLQNMNVLIITPRRPP